MPQQTNSEKDETVDYSYCFVIRTTKRTPTPAAPAISSIAEGGAEEEGGVEEVSPPAEVSLADVSPAMAASPFVYCYVAYRQAVGLKVTSEGTVSTMNKQALVLVSLLPIPNLAYSILGTLESTIYHVTHKPKSPAPTAGVSHSDDVMRKIVMFHMPLTIAWVGFVVCCGGGSDGVVAEELSEEAALNKTFEVAMDQIRSSWTDLDLADDGAKWRCNLSLPLFGEVCEFLFSTHVCMSACDSMCVQIFQFGVAVPSTVSGGDAGPPSVDFASLSLGAAATFTNGMNIISQFGTTGLLPHLWTLWELLVQGKDILVLGSSPDAAAEVTNNTSYLQSAYICN
jgi:hypothetical protein